MTPSSSSKILCGIWSGDTATPGGATRRQRNRLHGRLDHLSLLAVFIPILLMGGIFGRLFREFAVTLAVAVGVSMVVSLTTTPMMCAAFSVPIATRTRLALSC